MTIGQDASPRVTGNSLMSMTGDAPGDRIRPARKIRPIPFALPAPELRRGRVAASSLTAIVALPIAQRPDLQITTSPARLAA
jgi:hypothetical protein